MQRTQLTFGFILVHRICARSDFELEFFARAMVRSCSECSKLLLIFGIIKLFSPMYGPSGSIGFSMDRTGGLFMPPGDFEIYMPLSLTLMTVLL